MGRGAVPVIGTVHHPRQRSRSGVAPGRLDAVGRALAAHPAVHGALATTGEANLNVAVWFRDLGALGVDAAETVIIGEALKRPGVTRVTAPHA